MDVLTGSPGTEQKDRVSSASIYPGVNSTNMKQQAQEASRVHNIVYGTGVSASLAPSDAERYNTIGNMDTVIGYDQTIGPDTSAHFGLHSDTQSMFDNADKRKSTVVYGNDGTKDDSYEVALLTSAFHTAQMSDSITYYGSNNRYDMRGFDAMAHAVASQRSAFSDAGGCGDTCTRVNPNLVNDTSPILPASSAGSDPTVPQPTNMQTSYEKVSGATFYGKGSGEAAGNAEWYGALDSYYKSEKEDSKLSEYMLNTNQFPVSSVFSRT